MTGPHFPTQKLLVFPSRAVCILLTIVTALLFSGCAPRVTPEDLTPLPPLDVSGYQKSVREQMSAAYAKVEDDPTDAAANGYLGMLYRAYKSFASAEILLRRARQLQPDKVDWIYYHGEVFEQLAQYEEAMLAMRAVLKMEPNDVPAQLRLVELMLQTGEVEAAQKQLQHLVDTQANYSRVFVVRGTALEASGDLEAAATAWHKALALGPEFGRGHYALAQIYRRLGRAAEAEKHLARFKTIGNSPAPIYDPRLEQLFKLNASDRPLILAAQAAKATGDYAAALNLLERAIKRNPPNMETRAALVSGYATAAQVDKAEDHYLAGQSFDANHLEFNYAVGRLRLQQKRYGDAQNIFTAVTGRAPGHVLARAWLGRAQELGGDTAAAGISYRQAITIDPGNLTARRFYGAWLVISAPYSDAITALGKMSRAKLTDTPMIYAAIAQLHIKHSDYQAALIAVDRGLVDANKFDQQKAKNKLLRQRAALTKALSKP